MSSFDNANVFVGGLKDYLFSPPPPLLFINFPKYIKTGRENKTLLLCLSLSDLVKINFSLKYFLQQSVIVAQDVFFNLEITQTDHGLNVQLNNSMYLTGERVESKLEDKTNNLNRNLCVFEASKYSFLLLIQRIDY